MGDIQTAILHLLAKHSAGLPLAEIAHQLDISTTRAAATMFHAMKRAHIARTPDLDGTLIFTITRSGLISLTALDILAQRLDEKRHPARRAPTEAERMERPEPRRKVVLEIDQKFALRMAKTLHASRLPLDADMRRELRKIVKVAA